MHNEQIHHKLCFFIRYHLGHRKMGRGWKSHDRHDTHKKTEIGKIKKGRNHFEYLGTDGWVTLQCTCECVEWIQVAKDAEKWRSFVNMIIKFRIPQIAEEFPEIIMTIGLTERTRLISIPNYSGRSIRLRPNACLWNARTKQNNARPRMWWQRVMNHYFIWGW